MQLPGLIVHYSDRKVEEHGAKKIAEFNRKYATHPDGTIDLNKARHGKEEILRRVETAKKLDVTEPGAYGLEGAAFLGLTGYAMKRIDGPLSPKSIGILAASTALGAVVLPVLRMSQRVDAGLDGAAQIALAMDRLDKEKAQTLAASWTTGLQSETGSSLQR